MIIMYIVDKYVYLQNLLTSILFDFSLYFDAYITESPLALMGNDVYALRQSIVCCPKKTIYEEQLLYILA